MPGTCEVLIVSAEMPVRRLTCSSDRASAGSPAKLLIPSRYSALTPVRIPDGTGGGPGRVSARLTGSVPGEYSTAAPSARAVMPSRMVVRRAGLGMAPDPPPSMYQSASEPITASEPVSAASGSAESSFRSSTADLPATSAATAACSSSMAAGIAGSTGWGFTKDPTGGLSTIPYLNMVSATRRAASVTRASGTVPFWTAASSAGPANSSPGPATSSPAS